MMKTNKTVAVAALAALTLSSLGLNSCDTYAGQGAAYGAGAGAIIGGATTGRVRGAAVGAAIGAASGAIIGAAISEEESRRYGPPPPGGYPVARFSGTPGLVVSPYPPHNLVDVRGIPPGARVRDPSTGGIFIKP
jgi:osmotically inducible lipoprotein OsmB